MPGTLLYYKEAQKLGQKEFRGATLKGEYPYPSVLDEILSDDRINRAQDRGSTHVPLERVVGTRTTARTKAFARNFLPLMGENTEFARKWDKLCEAQMTEGIRDPVLVYEYLNRYYVQEGNKRVSVLRYCGADTVYARVLHVPPEETDSPEVMLYNELMEFQRCSGVNYIEFTKPGSCRRLQEIMGKELGALWTEEEKRDFSSLRFHFRKAYEANGGGKLSTTVGDALMAVLEVYGYPAVRTATEDELGKMQRKVWEEIQLKQEVVPVDLKVSTEEEKKPGLLTKMFSGGPKVLKVGFVHEGRDDIFHGWNQRHEAGCRHVETVFGERIETKTYYVSGDQPEEIARTLIQAAAEDGCNVIFATSSRFQQACLRLAVECPETIVLLCTQLNFHRYIRSYHTRLYEATFVLGAIAGAMAGEDPVGFLASKDDTETDEGNFRIHIAFHINDINAFALGVQLVNPRTRVYVDWFGREGAGPAGRRLAEQGLRLIYSADMSGEDRLGLMLVGSGNRFCLAKPVLRWGTYYETLLRSILEKSFQVQGEETDKAISYYWGFKEGVLDVECSDTLHPGTRNLCELLKGSIRTGCWYPYEGHFFDREGNEKANDHMAETLLRQEGWLMPSVTGTIPTFQEIQAIQEQARAAEEGTA